MVIVRTMQVKLWNGHFKIGEQAGWLQGWEKHSDARMFEKRSRAWTPLFNAELGLVFPKREMVNGCIRMH